jgi:hypothetical protein
MRTLTTVLLALTLTASALAQSLFETAGAGEPEQKTTLDWSGYTRGAAFGASPAFELSSLFGELGLQAKLSRGNAFLMADARLREGLQFGETGTVFQLKEAYAGYQSRKLDVYLGNQIVTWGRADGFNPTNTITPIDYFFLTPDPDDQTLPNFLLRARYHVTPTISLEAIGIPFFRSSVYRYDLFDMGENARFSAAALPKPTWDNGALAARMNFELPRVGFSLSYFRGYDPFYGFNIQSVDLSQPLNPLITNQPAYYRKDQLGADFALPLGAWIARGEIAATFTKDYENQMHVPNPGLYYVAGIEREFWDITAIFQYIGKYAFDFKNLIEPVLENPFDPVGLQQYIQDRIHYESTLFNRKIFQQQEQANHALFLSLSRSFAHETLRAECTGYYNITSEEYLFRPALSWNLTDALSATAGANIMGGPEQFIFDYSKEVMNGGFVQLKAHF